jgi:hypothetical protein
MRLGNILIGLVLLVASCAAPKECNAQPIGSIKTEEYTAGFEKKKIFGFITSIHRHNSDSNTNFEDWYQ